MWSELARLALNNLLRARARLLMTSGGVLVGTAAVILLVALTNGLQRSAEAGIGSSALLTRIDVGMKYDYGPGGAQSPAPRLTVDNVRRIARLPGVAAAIPSVVLQGGQLVVDDFMGYGQISGILPESLPYLNLNLKWGEADLQRGVIVGGNVGQGFYDPNQEEFKPITVDMQTSRVILRLNNSNNETQDIPLRIAAETVIDNSQNDYMIYMPLQQVMEYNAWITGTTPEEVIFDSLVVIATGRDTTSAVAKAIRELNFEAYGQITWLEQLESFFGTMRLMLGGIGGIALLVAAFGVANTMTMAILERTREIGLMKAIGATDAEVMTIFLMEAGMVGLLGGLSGLGVSLAAQEAVNRLVANLTAQGQDQSGGVAFLPIDVQNLGDGLMIIDPPLMLFALALATLVGLIAGAYPAYRAAVHLTPVAALKTD
ncbi:MAG: FtsX-like permease family protein [Anaerolineae bacterium]|nr:FtsX-like permease family protein [Anaerolineae bacterium]MDW8171959.1 FtsX-like permease family protein [Anaerolineae bacterium]